MKRNLPITQKEVDYSANTNILSTACPKGIITYVNQDFLDISGFTLEELIKKNHNIVRHPDVPEAVFEQLWSTIKSGRSWMGVVKNRCKNGDHYWVDAYVTPIERDGKIAEYQSIRRKPNREHVARSEKLFQDINAHKKWQPKFVMKLTSKLHLLTFIPIAMTLLSAALAVFGAPTIWFALPIGLSLIAGVAQLVTTRPLNQTIDLANKVIQNPVARYVYTGRHDDIGQLQLALRALEAETSGLIGRIADSSESMLTNANDLMNLASSSSKGIEKQFVETEQVAGAVQEMTNSIHQVAQNAQQSAQAMSDSHHQIREGQTMLTNTVDLLKSLNNELESTTRVVNDVQESSKAIVSVLDVINAVSEQTNLLALNAAIEAARAGDAGRVVA